MMRLMVTTPVDVILNADEVAHVRAEDESGSFGILPGHADFLTALTASVIAWRDAAARERYVAVRGGLLRVRGGDTIEIASREAMAGDDLHALESAVMTRYRLSSEAEEAARAQAARLQMAAIRQIISYLRGHRGSPQELSPLHRESIEGESG